MRDEARCGLAIAGGGLAGGLLALALRRARPDVELRIIETAPRLGGNHIWSFFDSDLDAAGAALVEPLIAARWDGYDVRFPAHARTLATGYRSITSGRLDGVLRELLPPEAILTGRTVTDLGPHAVALDDGSRIEAGGVVDARGAGRLAALRCGWQKFVGRELRLARPHGLDRPVVMDATVDQRDGYRFVYLLPFDTHRLLVEDTYYSDTPDLDPAALRERIASYAAGQGWTVAAVDREEMGVLPVAMGGDIDAYAASPVAAIGMRGGFFHPTTGYTLPDAVRIALLVAGQRDLSTDALRDTLGREARRLWRERRFYRLLNTMLFRAARPQERYRVLERFYRLDPALVARFYAGRSGPLDKLRILSGRPPVPVGRAVRAIMAKGAEEVRV